MSRVRGYGGWQRPAHGPLRTRGDRVVPRRAELILGLPREGAGDYRHPVPNLAPAVPRVTSSSLAEFHNPTRIDIPASYRAPWLPTEFIKLANGQPEFRPYQWRRPGWEARLARLGLLELARGGDGS